MTGPAYGTQQASSAGNLPVPCCRKAMSWRAFFYREGVLNANQLTAPASDEFDLVRGWQSLHDEHGVALHICVAAALRRGVTDEREAQQLALPGHNLQPGFTLSGLGALAEAALTCDRMVQF
ncbi:sulfurtransferase complex subunit TusD [Klebsiella pneumoniae]|uniref:Sulfurtransferase complex subunit TusD n=1 Tax=Klebsiella pneumoniae TaxID=573 RepID=A0A923J6Z4_KLEPN|nr:sulfurtransferase complex subunit TusD [Klebsiella pneumoniae]